MVLLWAEQNVGNLNSCTFMNLGTPVRGTKRRQSQNNARLGILELLCAEQNVGNLKNVLSRMLGLLCAEQNVGNLKNCTFTSSYLATYLRSCVASQLRSYAAT